MLFRIEAQALESICSIGLLLWCAPCVCQSTDPAESVPPPSGDESGETSENSSCQPSCQGEFVCRDDACVSACGAPCENGMRCQDGQCVKIFDDGDEADRAPEGSAHERHNEIRAVIENQNDARKDRKRKKKRRWFALLVNPGALIAMPVLYGIFAIPLNFQFAGDYVGLDVTATTFAGEMVGGAFELGIRILPFGNGLRGLYIVPRIGGGYPVGLLVSGEIGYAFMPKKFAFNLGAGGGYSPVIGPFPFGNISVGFGF